MPERRLPACPSAYRPQSFLAFDFGTRRIGVACGNTPARAGARPLTTVAADGDARFDAIEG